MKEHSDQLILVWAQAIRKSATVGSAAEAPDTGIPCNKNMREITAMALRPISNVTRCESARKPSSQEATSRGICLTNAPRADN